MARARRQPRDHVICEYCRREFRAITVFHLRNIHGYAGEHPVNDYKHKFNLRTASCLNSRKKKSAAKIRFWTKRGQHRTRASLLSEIQRVFRTGKRLRYHKLPNWLYLPGCRLFGSWQAAVETAGINYEEASGVRRWTRAKVIERIQELAAAGVPLNATHTERRFGFLHQAAIRQFPRSWAKALRAAGFDPEEHKLFRGRWDQQRAMDWVRRRLAKGRSIQANAAPRDLLGFVYKRLGMGWTAFIESLGITNPGIKKRRDWTRAKLLAEIRSRKSHGQPLNYRAVADSTQALIHQARKFYGSWDAARAAARV